MYCRGVQRRSEAVEQAFSHDALLRAARAVDSSLVRVRARARARATVPDPKPNPHPNPIPNPNPNPNPIPDPDPNPNPNANRRGGGRWLREARSPLEVPG